MTLTLRDATPDDAAAIAAIYNDAVLHGTAIWNDVTVDEANRIAWMAARAAQGYPVIVAERGGAVVGYASFGDWRAFDGFRGTVEHSVYVADGARGGGIGRVLLAALTDRARGCGKHVMVAAIEAGNAPSIALHRSLGFVETGVLRQVGQKFGRWLDLAFLTLQLDDRPHPGRMP
ncbi:N-acetyltransferase family protein [Fertoebacter nigrum]|uniref:N-acetyltransferase family protein n=1 Tax=Fertoeibacter niger TaxID=2656921 RepID=A0A8X8KPX9_9RHOB|nr:GNAT family N-acetyltransferase [Fertoeibacter niger]NUB46580.1 N-acetyltransferase family protein [Fertoeibacter niger]